MNIYSLSYNALFLPILRIATKILSCFIPKLKERNKNVVSSLKMLENIDRNSLVIWFHAASMGEFEQAKPVIESLKHANPAIQIVCTFFSPSGYNTQKKYAYADAVCYLPLDTNNNVQDFLNKLQPNIAVFVRYELWLNFISQLEKRNIPTLLINATYPNILLKCPIFSAFYEYLFNKFRLIYAVSDEHFNLFHQLNLNVELIRSSDTRIERIISKVAEAKNQPVIPPNYFNENSIVLVAGSTWEVDEKYLIYVYDKINSIYNNILRLVLVPHEPTPKHIANLTSQLKNYVLLSELSADNHLNENKLIIVDSIGKLLKLYGNANVAYIGGGFGVGVHSLTEPAGYCLPLCSGTNSYNSPDAKGLVDVGALTIVNDKDELFNWVETIIIDRNFAENSGQAALNYINASAGATKTISDKIIEMIDIGAK